MLGKVSTLTRGSIVAMFLVTPLVFATFTTEALEINKQFVMVVLVLLATLALLGSMVAHKRVAVRGGWWVNVVPLGFVATVLISTTFSIAGPESWIGYSGQEYVSFLTAVTGVLLFYTVITTADAKLMKQSWIALLVSASLISLVAVLSLLEVYLLPFTFAHTLGFNTIGNINNLAAWLIPVMMVSLGIVITDRENDRSLVPSGMGGVLIRVLTVWVSVLTMFLLIAIDYWSLWAALVLGLVTLICLGWTQVRDGVKPKRLLVPGALLLIACAGWLLKSPFEINLPIVLSPSVATSWDVATQTLATNTSTWLFGSGPGSFDLDYVHYRPVEVNATAFWNTRFDRAQLHPITLLATNGVLGLLLWLAVVLVITTVGARAIISNRDSAAWRKSYVLFAGWLSLLAVHALNPVNLSLTILFWGLGGLVVAESALKLRHRDFSQAPRLALGAASGLVILLVAGVLTVFTLYSRHAADIAFARAARLEAEGTTPQQLVTEMLIAVRHNPSNPVFQRNLATAYLALSGVTVREGLADGDFSADDKQKLIGVIDPAIQAGTKALTTGEYDGLNWSVNGLLYRELMPFLEDAQNYAVSMYTKALELEPTNPAHQTDLGRVYLAVADRAQTVQELDEVDAAAKDTARVNEEENLRIAVEHFEASLRLKPDYAPAHYYLAATYERQGNLEDAAAGLEALTRLHTKDVDLAFQLAVIYLKMHELDKAQVELERIIGMHPNHSNALWYLAAIKADGGDTESALEILYKLQSLNPEHEAVAKSISDLQAGEQLPADPGPLSPDTLTDVVQPPEVEPAT